MKLAELMSNPINNVVSKMDVCNLKPITNDKGDIVKIIIEYVPDVEKLEGEKMNWNIGELDSGHWLQNGCY